MPYGELSFGTGNLDTSFHLTEALLCVFVSGEWSAKRFLRHTPLNLCMSCVRFGKAIPDIADQFGSESKTTLMAVIDWTRLLFT